jgi:hypothetical protein
VIAESIIGTQHIERGGGVRYSEHDDSIQITSREEGRLRQGRRREDQSQHRKKRYFIEKKREA